jgi:hypothetical protein
MREYAELAMRCRSIEVAAHSWVFVVFVFDVFVFDEASAYAT